VRKVALESLTVNDTRCSWTVRDHPLDFGKATSQTAFILHELQPYTRYAVYVQTYTILSAKTGARSPILYFTTKPKSMYLLYSFHVWYIVLFDVLKFMKRLVLHNLLVMVLIPGILIFFRNALCPEKRDRQYVGRNFNKCRQLFIIFGMNHPDNPCD